MGRNWHHTDELRENWILLRVGLAEPQESTALEFWEVAVGNADSLVRTSAGEVPTSCANDVALLDSLISTLDEYRQVSDAHTPLLVTANQETLQQLRAALLSRQDELESVVSLRGFTHLSLEEQLQQRFGQGVDEIAPSRDPDSEVTTKPRRPETSQGELRVSQRLTELWELWTQIFALLPPDSIRGTPL